MSESRVTLPSGLEVDLNNIDRIRQARRRESSPDPMRPYFLTYRTGDVIGVWISEEDAFFIFQRMPLL